MVASPPAPTGGGTSKPATGKLDTFFACGKVGGYQRLEGQAPFGDEPVGPADRLRREKSAERGHEDPQILLEREGRIDHDQSGTDKAALGAGRSDRQFAAQNIWNAQLF